VALACATSQEGLSPLPAHPTTSSEHGSKPSQRYAEGTDVLRPLATSSSLVSMSAATMISIASVAIALASLIVTYGFARRTAVRARKPVLVFVDEPEQGAWVLRNVGNGPALNVVVAQRQEGQWFNPVIVPPLSTESSFSLRWLGRINTTGLGVTYADFEDRRYTSTLGSERSRTYEGNRLPDWHDGEIRRYWEVNDAHQPGTRWAARESAFSAE
jgi:hypothetical protein